MNSCRLAAQFLLSIMQEMTVTESLPTTAVDAKLAVERHEQCIRAAFEDPRIVRLQNEGGAIMKYLQKDERIFGDNEDYR